MENLKNIKFYPSLYEGVADKYAEKEFNIIDDKIHKFEKKFLKENNKQLVGKITHDWKGKELRETTNVYINPKSLDNFDQYVRAIIMKNGDLYVADNSHHIIHIDIVNFLIKKDIVKIPNKEDLDANVLQDLMYAEEEYPQQFISVHRLRDTNIFGISESTNVSLNNMPFIQAAEKVNPNFKFANKGVFSLRDSMLKEEDSSSLDKKLIGTITDSGGEEVKIYAVNGQYVKGVLDFIEFIEGGHYYVTSYPGYKKFIGKDEIWVDNVFLSTPRQLKAIVLHEFLERNKMKYEKWTYDKAHEYANKKEKAYRKKGN